MVVLTLKFEPGTFKFLSLSSNQLTYPTPDVSKRHTQRLYK
uniref:Uncharacterized protein n=1 Tax=Medicago truncatula TaxID=3880 RepID=A2Q3T6_MEDTR|nr:hypothetical protein MtrDRAFT_AC155889g37v2 [Medicago truncatula]